MTKKPTVLNEGESFNARQAMMQAKRHAPPPPKPTASSPGKK